MESNTSTTGGSTRKLIYRGAVDPTKTVRAGNLEFRYRFVGGYNRLDARLVSPPGGTVTLIGDRAAWLQSTLVAATMTVSWTNTDWNTWKELDTQGTSSHLYHFTLSNENTFYKASSTVRLSNVNALLIETF